MMQRPIRRLAWLALSGACASAVVASACGDDGDEARSEADAAVEAARPDADVDAAPQPKGDRVLGLGLDPSAADFYPSLLLARDAGVTTTNLSFTWDRIEQPFDAGPDADTDAATAIFQPALHGINLLLADQKTSVALSAAAIDVDGPHLPVDLVGRALDDEEVLTRYVKVEDYVLGELPDTVVTALLVGESVDRPLGDDPARWAAFATFVSRAAAHAKTRTVKVKVGFTIDAEALSAKKDLAAAALAASDVVAVTYVPVDAAGRARPVTEVAQDLERVVAAAPAGKPILLRAIGYPSAEAAGGSDDQQVAFVTAAFGAWDRGAERIGTVTFWSLDDLTEEGASAAAARAGDPKLAATLGSLGFRSAGGRTKPALGALRSGARARGF